MQQAIERIAATAKLQQDWRVAAIVDSFAKHSIVGSFYQLNAVKQSLNLGLYLIIRRS